MMRVRVLLPLELNTLQHVDDVHVGKRPMRIAEISSDRTLRLDKGQRWDKSRLSEEELCVPTRWKFARLTT